MVSTCMRTIFDAKGDAGVRVVGADAQYAPVGRGSGVVVSTCMQRRGGVVVSTHCAFGCHLAILSSSMMESHVVISTPLDAAKRMSYLPSGRAAMSTCMQRQVISGNQRPWTRRRGCRTVTCRDEGGNQRPSEAIRGHQRPSEAIRGHQRPSEAIRAQQRQGDVVTVAWPDEAGNQPDEAGNQPDEAGNHVVTVAWPGERR